MATQKQAPGAENPQKGQQQKTSAQQDAGPQTAGQLSAPSLLPRSPLLQPAHLRGLQRAVGNRAVQRLLADRGLRPASCVVTPNAQGMPGSRGPMPATPIQLKRDRATALPNPARVVPPGQSPLEIYNSPEQWAFIDKCVSESEGEKKLDYLLAHLKAALRDLDTALTVQKYLDDGGSLQGAQAALAAAAGKDLVELKVQLRQAFAASMEAAEDPSDKAVGNPLELATPKNAQATIYSQITPKEKSAGNIVRGDFVEIVGLQNIAVKKYYKIRSSDKFYFTLQDEMERALHRYVATDVGGLALWGPAGPKPTDVQQGQIGNCYLLAPLQAIADKQPDFIKGLFENETATKVTVNFYNKNQKVPIRVDKKVMTAGRKLITPATEVTQGLWPAMIEKAFAIFKAQLSSKKPLPSYGATEGGHSADTLEYLTGNPRADVEETVVSSKEKDKQKWLGQMADVKLAVVAKLLGNKNNILLVSSKERKLTVGGLRVEGVPEEYLEHFYTSKENEPIIMGHAHTVHDLKGQEIVLKNPHGAKKYTQTLNKYQFYVIFDGPRFTTLPTPPQKPKASTTALPAPSQKPKASTLGSTDGMSYEEKLQLLKRYVANNQGLLTKLSINSPSK